MKIILSLVSALILLTFQQNVLAQTDGSSIRQDTVIRKMPPQVYGRPKNKKRVDSLAVIRRMKQLELLEKNFMDSSAQPKITIIHDSVVPAESPLPDDSMKNSENVPEALVPTESTIPGISNKSSENVPEALVLTESTIPEISNKSSENVPEALVPTESTIPEISNKSSENNPPAPPDSTFLKTTPLEQYKIGEGITDEATTIQVNPIVIPESTNWTLERCVEYAREHNLQVQSAVLNERLAKLQLAQTKGSRLPNINADASLGESYGRSIDPTSNQFVTKGFAYNTLGLNAQALVFGWFQRKYQTQQGDIDIRSAQESNAQLKDDISLNVATGYLRVLLAKEQVKIAEAQEELDEKQLEQTIKFANAGKIPELNVAQMQSQVANDKLNTVSSKTEEQLALLQLRALLNFDFQEPFDIAIPNTDLIDITDNYSNINPLTIYDIAMKQQHRMQSNNFKLESAKKSLYIAKSALYPQLSIFGTLGTNFSSNVQNITGQTLTGEQVIGNVDVSGQKFPITVPIYKYSSVMKPIFVQYGENIRANVGLSLNVPIFNGQSTRINIERAHIGILSQEILNEQDKQRLKQDIFSSHLQVTSSKEKYVAAKQSQDAAKRSLDFAVKRYAIGMITTFEYMTVQNTYNNACSAVLQAKYDFIFKLKVLDYYMGNPIKL